MSQNAKLLEGAEIMFYHDEGAAWAIPTATLLKNIDEARKEFPNVDSFESFVEFVEETHIWFKKWFGDEE